MEKIQNLTQEDRKMFKTTFFSALLLAAALGLMSCQTAQAQQQGYGRQYAPHTTAQDSDRFLHYPYVYYPQNFWAQEYYRSNNSLYNRYPTQMQIPSYNQRWMNYYPESRRYHMGHHFFLDVM